MANVSPATVKVPTPLSPGARCAEPFTVTVLVKVPVPAKVPVWMVVGPVKVLLPSSCSTPAPILVRLPLQAAPRDGASVDQGPGVHFDGGGPDGDGPGGTQREAAARLEGAAAERQGAAGGAQVVILADGEHAALTVVPPL